MNRGHRWTINSRSGTGIASQIPAMPPWISNILSANSNLLQLLLGMFVVLSLGSAVRIVALRNSTPELTTKRMGSLKVWWILAVLIALAVVFGRVGAAILLAIASTIGLREFLALIGFDRIGRLAAAAAFLMVPLQFSLVAAGWESEARWLLPTIAFPVLSTARLVKQGPDGFIRTTAGMYAGVMFSFSTAA